MHFRRASGILLHPTSLPNEFGIGDFGKSAFEFVDFLESAGQTYWQILPLGPTGYGDSPYQCFSAFAGNTNLISPELLVEDGLLDSDDSDLKQITKHSPVDFGAVIPWKESLLRKVFAAFRKKPNPDTESSFEKFRHQVAFWLEDYALFRAIKQTQGGKSWLEWKEPLRSRDEDTLSSARIALADEILAQQFYQFLFFRQWTRLRNYANGKGIRIIGDLPIFVAMDSADTWCRPEQFKIDEDGTPAVVAGVPPDYFSKTGQLWGNPVYDWERMRSEGFYWWKERLRFTLKSIDIVRIDHFRGFSATWEVPSEDKTAENGNWVGVPGEDLFNALFGEFGDLPVIAEDLGVITPDVERLRDGFGLPGMRILQYGFGGDAYNTHLPHNFVRNCVGYTGTHDNDTLAGWFKSLPKKSKKDETASEREYCLDYLDTDGKDLHWDMIRELWSSVADTAIVPLQDVLGLESKSRMNTPATKSGNWKWRVDKKVLNPTLADKLLKLTRIYGRERE